MVLQEIYLLWGCVMRYISYVLTALGAMFLLMFLVVRDKKSSVQAIVFKTFTSLIFIGVAFAAINENPWKNLDQIIVPASLIIAGLTLGLVGDIALDFKVYLKGISDKYPEAKKGSDDMTYLGMLCFGLGHIAYITAAALRFPGNEINLLWGALASIGATAIIFVLSIFVLKMQFSKFLLPAISYSILLCWFTAITAAGMVSRVQFKSTLVLLVGAILFLLSDLVLSMTYFSKPEDYQREGPLNPESKVFISINHVLYYAAQFCIALSLKFL